MTVIVEIQDMTTEEIVLILRHLQGQGYPAELMEWEHGVSVTIAITLPDTEPASLTGKTSPRLARPTISREASGNSAKKLSKSRSEKIPELAIKGRTDRGSIEWKRSYWTSRPPRR